MKAAPLVQVSNLVKVYGGRGGLLSRRAPEIRAVDGVSLDIPRGETVGLVGESGSGKSTTGRILLQLEPPTSGRIRFEGRDVTGLSKRDLKPYRRKMQVIFQDPYSALNPRMKVGEFVAEPLVVHGVGSGGSEQRDRVAGLFRQVGLSPDFMARYPHEFSGGQRQRINIARAIALRPDFIVADEPITALDVSIQAQIVNLFKDLQEELGITYLFIAHDLSMVRFLCHRVAVMLRGRIVELASTAALFGDPQHPYTRALLSAIPIPDPDIERGRHHIAFDPADNPAGPDATLEEVDTGHFVLR
jgi:peptide/nickel transport system ATP-binding protein